MSRVLPIITTHSPRAGHDGQTAPAHTHGPLRPLLIAMTVVTGLVDAFSYLTLGHVFVANMTGNVVFLGFGLAGVGGVAADASLVAILAFASGAFLGGRSAARMPLHRGTLLAVGAASQAILVSAAAIVAAIAGVTETGARLCLVCLLAVAMGGQNAVARRLAVPDLTTTVLTLTVTGLVADSTSWRVRGRRLVPVMAMLGGAFAGGLLIRLGSSAAPLWLAAALLVSCSVIAHAATRRPHSLDWR
jgi:uncharacterized membrane protein YoaK (UPF0700 family)